MHAKLSFAAGLFRTIATVACASKSLAANIAWIVDTGYSKMAISTLATIAYFGSLALIRTLSQKIALGSTIWNSNDRRPPVLYFRSFNDDGTEREARRVSPFEEEEEGILCRAVRRIGPLIALDNPRDARTRIGATRIKVSDTSWRVSIGAMLHEAGAVIIQTGASDGLLWEVKQAVTRLRPTQLMLVITNQASYQAFRAATLDLFPVELPSVAPARRVLIFGEKWRPVFPQESCAECASENIEHRAIHAAARTLDSEFGKCGTATSLQVEALWVKIYEGLASLLVGRCIALAASVVGAGVAERTALLFAALVALPFANRQQGRGIAALTFLLVVCLVGGGPLIARGMAALLLVAAMGVFANAKWGCWIAASSTSVLLLVTCFSSREFGVDYAYYVVEASVQMSCALYLLIPRRLVVERPVSLAVCWVLIFWFF